MVISLTYLIYEHFFNVYMKSVSLGKYIFCAQHPKEKDVRLHIIESNFEKKFDFW